MSFFQLFGAPFYAGAMKIYIIYRLFLSNDIPSLIFDWFAFLLLVGIGIEDQKIAPTNDVYHVERTDTT